MADQLAGKRILVVEDEYLIATDLSRALQKEEAVVVGPVGDLEKGLSLLATEEVDAAVLDVNLAGTPSYPIADKLREKSIPYMFLTGYDGWALPDAYRSARCVPKPSSMYAVLHCVRQLVTPEAE